MKGVILSLTKRVILKERNIRALEAIYFRLWLLATGKFSQVDFVSTKLKSRDATEDVEYYRDAATTNLNEYDHVFLHNDTDNFMGGDISKHTIKQIKELCEFTGTVNYLYTDPNLHLKNLAKVIYDRQVHGTKTKYNTDLRITEVEVKRFANLNWRIIWSGRDFEFYLRNEYNRITPSLRCNITKWVNVEFFKFMFTQRKIELPHVPLSQRSFDLAYYGNWRPKRENKIRLYLNTGLRKRVIGFDESKLLLPETEYLAYSPPESLAGLVQQAVASIVIGDPMHNNNITTARFYENILFDVCSFIDVEYDPQRKLYRSEFLKNYMYVRNGNELAQKITQVKNNENLFKEIINHQKQEIL